MFVETADWARGGVMSVMRVSGEMSGLLQIRRVGGVMSDERSGVWCGARSGPKGNKTSENALVT